MATVPALTVEQVEELKSLYAGGFTQVQLAEHFGVQDHSIRYWLHKSGIKTHYNLRLTDAQVQEAMRDYATGISTLVIGKRFGCSPQTVANMLQARGVALREAGGSSSRLAVRDDAFDVRSPEVDYWVGIMATDGCVTGNKDVVDQVKLALKEEDIDHVECFRQFLGAAQRISCRADEHPTDSSRVLLRHEFKVRSRRLVEALRRFGVVPRKTYTLEMSGGIEMSRDFWRGAIDGDGHLGIHASNQGPMACFKLTGASERFLAQLLQFLRDAGVRGQQSIHVGQPDGRSLATHVKYNVQLGACAALDATVLLYVDGDPALDRKSRMAAEMILCGVRGELVGTLHGAWKNDRAAAWAERRLAVRGGRTRELQRGPIARANRAGSGVVSAAPESQVAVTAG